MKSILNFRRLQDGTQWHIDLVRFLALKPKIHHRLMCESSRIKMSQFLQQLPKDRLCTQWHTRFSPGRPRVRIPLIARKIPRKREASPQAIIGNLNDSSNIPHYRENENGDRLKLEAKLHMMPEGREYVQCGAASNPLVSTTEQWQLIMSSNHSFCIIKRLLPSCMLNKMS